MMQTIPRPLRSIPRVFSLLTVVYLALSAGPIHARAVLLDNTSRSLKGIPVPVTPGLLDGDQPIVVDKTAAL